MPAWLAALLTRKMLICVFTGFSSGLPLYLLLNLLPAWLRSEGVDLKTIGFFALIQFPYTWKFLWSPLLDRYSIPGFGRRRGWMLLTQVGLLLAIGFAGRPRSARDHLAHPVAGRPACLPFRDAGHRGRRLPPRDSEPTTNWAWATPCTSTPTASPAWFPVRCR
jgi:hypothetical protein